MYSINKNLHRPRNLTVATSGTCPQIYAPGIYDLYNIYIEMRNQSESVVSLPLPGKQYLHL